MTIEYIVKCDKCGNEKVMIDDSLEFAKDTEITHSGGKCGGTYKFLPEGGIVKEKVTVKNSKVNKTKVPSETKPTVLENNTIKKEIEPGMYYTKGDREYACKFCPFNAKGEYYNSNHVDYKGDCSKSINQLTYCYGEKTNFRLNNKFTSESNLSIVDDVNITVGGTPVSVNDIRRLFVVRTNNYSLYKEIDRGKDNPGAPDTYEDLTDQIISSSLLGFITIGVRPKDPRTNLGKWLCYDIDKKKTGNAKEAVDMIIKLLKDWYNLTGYAEMSGSKDSYHIWVFLKPTNYDSIIEFDNSFRDRCKKEQPGLNKCIDQRVENNLGGMIKLPYNINIKNGGRSRFVDGVDISKIQQEELPSEWAQTTDSNINVEKVSDTHEIPVESDVDKVIDSPKPIVKSRVNKIVDLQETIFNSKESSIKSQDTLIDNNKKIKVTLKCDECGKTDDFTDTYKNIKSILDKPHPKKPDKSSCGGKIRQITYKTTYKTTLQIEKGHTDSIDRFLDSLQSRETMKTDFQYQINHVDNQDYESELILSRIKAKSDGIESFDECKRFKGWLITSDKVKGKIRANFDVPEEVLILN